MHGITLAIMLSAMSMTPAPLSPNLELLPSTPAAAVTQATAGDVRLVAWELANGTGIEAQLMDATTHESLSERLTLGSVGTNNAVRIGSVQTRPFAAGLEVDDTAIFFVAWHAELLDTNGNSIGTDVVARRVTRDAGGSVVLDPVLRISGYDQDTDPSAGSESRSAPVVAAQPEEREFLVLWTHWPEGKELRELPPLTSDPLYIHALEIPVDGDTGSSGIVRLDTLTAPVLDGFPTRRDSSTIFLAAVPRTGEAGYLLAWSDPAQEDGDEDRAQIYTKLLPENIAATDFDTRVPHADSVSITEGTGRLSLAALPGESGYLLAFEDMRGKAPLAGVLLDRDGISDKEPIRLLDAMQPGDHAFLSPQLVGENNRLLLFAAVGDRPIGSAPHEAVLKGGRIVRRELDIGALAFNPAVEDFESIVEGYPQVNIYFADNAHAAAAFPQGGDVVFSVVPNEARIRIDVFDSKQVPVPGTPGGGNNASGGGGSSNPAILLLAAFITLFRRSIRVVPVAAGFAAQSAIGAPPDVDLLHTRSGDTDCYRAVMYREVKEIHLGTRWGETPLPAEPAVELAGTPAGWLAEVIVSGDHQYLLLKPAGFDAITGLSIGKVCMTLPVAEEKASTLPYTYALVATGSRISANARDDEGLSEDELRNLAKRRDRLQRSGDITPQELDEKVKRAKRLKDLFD